MSETTRYSFVVQPLRDGYHADELDRRVAELETIVTELKADNLLAVLRRLVASFEDAAVAGDPSAYDSYQEAVALLEE